MDKFEEKEMIKKRTFSENAWYNWLVNYIFQPIKNGKWC